MKRRKKSPDKIRKIKEFLNEITRKKSEKIHKLKLVRVWIQRPNYQSATLRPNATKNKVIKRSMFKLGACKGSHIVLGLVIWCFLFVNYVYCVKNKSDSIARNQIPSKIQLFSTSGPATDNVFSKSESFLFILISNCWHFFFSLNTPYIYYVWTTSHLPTAVRSILSRYISLFLFFFVTKLQV